MDSIERLIRRNAFDVSGMFGYEGGGTVYTRVNRLAASDRMVGFALDCLREAFYGGWADRMIIVTYEALTRDPAGQCRSSRTPSASRRSRTISPMSSTAPKSSTPRWARRACTRYGAKWAFRHAPRSCRQSSSGASRTTPSG